MSTKTAKRYWKDILAPGIVTTADGPREITSADVTTAEKNFRAMKASGAGDVPILAEHVEFTDPVGNPRPRRDVAVDQLNATKGWITGVRRTKDNRLQGLCEIVDAATAERIDKGEIRYVSPTIRGLFTDSKGNDYRRAITHVALTATPRYRNRDEFTPVPAMALSDLGDEDAVTIEDNEALAMADDDTNGNPDLPKESKSAPQLEALLAILTDVCGFALPADTTEETLIERLLTAAKTAKAIKDKQEAEEKAAKNAGPEQPIEERTGMQMSESQQTELIESMRKKLAANHGQTVKARLESLKKSGRIAPSLFDNLSGRLETIQLSDTGDEVPSISLSELCDLIEKTTPEGALVRGLQLAEAEEESHPDGDAYYSGDATECSDEEAKKVIAEMSGFTKGVDWGSPAKDLQAAG